MLFLLIFLCLFLDFALSSPNLKKEEIENVSETYTLSLIEKYAKRIDDLQRKFEEKFHIQDEQIRSLLNDLSEKSEIINGLREEIKILQSKQGMANADQNAKINDFTHLSRNGTLKTKSQYRDSFNKIRQDAPCFTNHVLIFDTVKTNIQNAYHPHTGVFIVPEAGVYVFTWSLFIGESNNHHSLELIVNSEVWGEIHAHTTSGVVSESTGIAVVQVNEGDDVYVRSATVSSNGDVWSNIYGKTFFAGWKL